MFSVRLEDGVEYVVSRGAVAIVALDADERVVLVRQRRPAVSATLVEIPAGFVEDGEEPLATARRELREETGLHGGRWRELASFWVAPGFVRHRITLYLAQEVEEGDAAPDAGEELEVVRWPLEEIDSRLGEIEDAKTIAGLMLLLAQLRK
jgi:ADP-ribose pyrophosphatase